MSRSTSNTDLSGLHVLVVEDEAALAFPLMQDLKAVGAIPLGPYPTVAQAVDAIRTGIRLDAALLNVRLHGELVFPVAEELARRAIPFVFVTGNDAVAFQRYPGVPVHPKPADMVDVVESLANLIATKRLSGSP